MIGFNMTHEQVRQSIEWVQKIEAMEAEQDSELEMLRHYYNSTKGLYCIDRDPNEVDIEWIRNNAFRLD